MYIVATKIYLRAYNLLYSLPSYEEHLFITKVHIFLKAVQLSHANYGETAGAQNSWIMYGLLIN